MNLLLLLSALLSALTGGVSAMRAPAAAHAVASAAAAVQAKAQRTAVVSRPQQAVASLSISARAPSAAIPVVPILGEPLYASRRRE